MKAIYKLVNLAVIFRMAVTQLPEKGKGMQTFSGLSQEFESSRGTSSVLQVHEGKRGPLRGCQVLPGSVSRQFSTCFACTMPLLLQQTHKQPTTYSDRRVALLDNAVTRACNCQPHLL